MATLYEASRLYVNFFQPSFKLRDKRREGGRVKKRYFRPATPCDRLLASSEISEDTRRRLGEIRERLDPIALLERIRAQQKLLANIAAGEPVTDIKVEHTDLDAFMRALATAFHGGEVRPTHRRKPTAPRHWRTRIDSFEDVWEGIEGMLVASPDLTAKELFERTRLAHPDRFADGQLRTLQRRARTWRQNAARALLALKNADAPNDG